MSYLLVFYRILLYFGLIPDQLNIRALAMDSESKFTIVSLQGLHSKRALCFNRQGALVARVSITTISLLASYIVQQGTTTVSSPSLKTFILHVLK